MNISMILQMAADAGGDRVGLVCDGRRWTYGEIFSAATSAAHLFRTAGSAHVSLLDESSEASAIALFGAAMAGAPYAPLNYRLPDDDLSALISRLTPAYVIGDENRITHLDPDNHQTAHSRADFISACEAVSDAPDEETDEPVAVQLFTSGTTAAPKAAILGHSNLTSYILGTVEFMSAPEEDAALVSVPPYHIAGIAALLSSVYAMRRIVLLPAFDPANWIRLVAEEKVTNAFVVPTMLARIVETLYANGGDVSSLRAIAYGGGRMPLELIERALDILPETNFTNAYGLTETSSTIALLGPEDHRIAHQSSDPKIRARLGSVGKPLPTVELEIRDDDGRALAAGDAGEIFVRGEQVSGEYRERSALDSDGWFPTRDAGYLDEEGYLFLSGRADDVIVRGGENMSPGEIEDVLRTHPAIADAAALGIPSTEWGETVGVAIAAAPGETRPSDEEIKALVKDRLRSSRVPERIVFVDALPYNEMGKLLRREIKALF